MKLPAAKKDWQPETKKHFNTVKKNFHIDPEHADPLMGTMQNYNRFYECEKILKKEGLTFTSESGQIKVHPLLTAQKNAWNAYLSGLRILGLHRIEEKKRPAHSPERGPGE